MEILDFLLGTRRHLKSSRKPRVFLNYNGYIMVYHPDHPRAWNTGYVLAHYYLWERYNKACLLKNAHVRHKDKNKRNNKKDNLILSHK